MRTLALLAIVALRATAGSYAYLGAAGACDHTRPPQLLLARAAKCAAEVECAARCAACAYYRLRNGVRARAVRVVYSSCVRAAIDARALGGEREATPRARGIVLALCSAATVVSAAAAAARVVQRALLPFLLQ